MVEVYGHKLNLGESYPNGISEAQARDGKRSVLSLTQSDEEPSLHPLPAVSFVRHYSINLSEYSEQLRTRDFSLHRTTLYTLLENCHNLKLGPEHLESEVVIEELTVSLPVIPIARKHLKLPELMCCCQTGC